MVYGFIYIILYINLFSLGYTIKDYLEYLFTKTEGYLLPVGLLLTTIGFSIRRK